MSEALLRFNNEIQVKVTVLYKTAEHSVASVTPLTWQESPQLLSNTHLTEICMPYQHKKSFSSSIFSFLDINLNHIK